MKIIKSIQRLFVLSLVTLSLIAAQSCSDNDGAPVDHQEMQDGEYEGLGEGRSGMIKVAIIVKDHLIHAIRILSQSESKFAQPAENEIIERVLQAQTTEGVDVVTGATLTSKGMLAAIESAIKASKGIAEDEVVYQDTICDIVVVGAGGAGLSAAIQAAEKGAHVIVLEKQGIIGGNTNYSTGGLNAAETFVQRQKGIEDSRKSHFDDTMKGGYYLNDSSLVATLVNEAADAIDWLTGLGADMSDVGTMAGSSHPRTHRPQGGSAIGPHLMSVLSKASKAKNISIRTRHTVTAITESNGAATGVRVNTLNGSYTIQSKAVIIATGGFGANLSMIGQYRPKLESFCTSNHQGATGDAFEWVAQFQVPLVLMDQIQTHPTGEKGSHLLISEAVRGNGAILVNKEGLRFTNEMLTRDKVSEAILSQTEEMAYLVFDQSVRESLSAIENYDQQGLLIEGESKESLAKTLGMPVEAFASTIDTYNRFQAEGEDKDYGRLKEEMPRALAKAPYYAIEVEPVIHHTMGGIRINPKAEVVNRQGEPVPGLYAAGEVTGGVHGGNRLGGNAIADIVVYGQIAGESAARFVGLD